MASLLSNQPLKSGKRLSQSSDPPGNGKRFIQPKLTFGIGSVSGIHTSPESPPTPRQLTAADNQLQKIADKEGLRMHPVKSDGNCLFSSIATHLQSTGIVTSHTHVRAELVEYVRTHPHLADHAADGSERSIIDIVAEEDGGLENYLTKMSCDKSWGDGIMLSTASLLYSRPIVVHYADETKKPINLSDTLLDPGQVMHFGYLGENHYVPLLLHSLSDYSPSPQSPKVVVTGNNDNPNIHKFVTGLATTVGVGTVTSPTPSENELSLKVKVSVCNSNEMSCMGALSGNSESPFHPNASVIKPQILNNRKLFFQAHWFDTYPWLHHDPSVVGILCFYCNKAFKMGLLSTTKFVDSAFLSTGYSNWKNAAGINGRFSVHQSSQCHASAKEHLVDRLVHAPISSRISTQLAAAQVNAQKCLGVIFSTCRYLLQQGLPLRGHVEEDGNFMQLLRLRSNDVPEMVQWMKRKHDFHHHDIQDEILKLYADTVLRKVRSMVQESASYALIVDGTQDINRKEQESICIRYVGDDMQPAEAFVGFYDVPDTTGKTLSRCVEDVLLRLELPIEKLRGQTYDGAANMSGAYSGCQSILSRKQPLALFVHCAAHCTNLVASATCSASSIVRDKIQLVNELGVLCSASGKFKALFTAIATSDNDAPIRNLKPLCPTRWLVRIPAIQATVNQYDAILKALAEASNECGAEVAAKASGLLRTFEDGATILSLFMAIDILQPLEKLNRALQGVRMSVGGMLEAIESVRSHLVSFRTEAHFVELFSEAEIRIDELGIEHLRLQRQRKPPVRFTGPGENFHPQTAQELYRIEYFKMLDVSISQITERFSSSIGLKRYAQLESILSSGMVNDIALLYPELGLEGDLQMELTMFRKTQNMTMTSRCNLDDYVQRIAKMTPEVRGMFPLVEALCRLLLVNPASSATAERSFSSLRRLKTYLRSTIGQQRLNHVALGHIHKSILKEISTRDLMKDFVQSRGSRIVTFGHID